MIRRVRHFTKCDRAHRGQIIIFIAVAAVSMIGMVGLAIDLGYSFVQKRAVQNAADAAAAAGTRAVTQWSTTNSVVTAQPDVIKIVTANNMGDATQKVSCSYVSDNDKSLGSCSQVVPEDATGVHVEVSETHETFFMRIIPGGPKTVTTSASATAHAQKVIPDGSGGPFIVCGAKADLQGGGWMQILNDGGPPYSLNQAAFGRTFIVHHSQVEDCGAQSNSYKGYAIPEDNIGKTVPGWFRGTTGTQAGPVREDVRGVGGCNSASSGSFDCVMYLPLATADRKPDKHGNDIDFYVVAYGVFEVQSCGANCHQATLRDKYIVETPPDLPSWTPGSWARGNSGVIAIRLTK